MRFNPDRRLIDLMVGNNLYGSPHVAMRELIQNAEDACSLQQLKGADYLPDILVRYSASQNWVSVTDNGLGMNQETIDKSFAAVGATKDNVSHIRDLLAANGGNRQIAQFGVGILSCFGVADKVTFSTKMDGEESLAFAIADYHEEWQHLDEPRSARGTTIHLQLKPGGPMQAADVPGAVERYARHAAHVRLEDVDGNSIRTVPEQWHGKAMRGAMPLEDPALRGGFLALHPAWDTVDAIPQVELVMCNAGFLVKERELGLLPNEAIGSVGELDVSPGSLTIQINRESFQGDDHWQQLRNRMTVSYNKLIEAKLDEWEQALEPGAERKAAAAIERGALLLARGPTRNILRTEIAERLDRLIPTAIRIHHRGASTPTMLSKLLEAAQTLGVIYYTREGEAPRQSQRSMQQGSSSIQITEVTQTEGIRAMHLQAKGAVVLACHQRQYPYFLGGGQQNVTLHEADLLNELCQKLGLRCVPVNDASAEEVELTGAADSALFSNLLGLGEPLKLVALDGFSDRVLYDFAGRLLNCRNDEIREILRYLPDAVGSPVRRTLLKIYMDIQTWRLEEARKSTKELLTMADLADQAQLSTGHFLRLFLEEKLKPLIDPPEKST
jgi:hypothetical protein